MLKSATGGWRAQGIDKERRERQMKLGVALPIVDIGGEPGAIRDFVQAAEAIGYQGIAAPDHVAVSGNPRHRFCPPSGAGTPASRAGT